jgi:GNAT acetyltransferase-like protein
MTRFRQYASFEELPAEDRSLFDSAGANSFFSSLWWFEVFAKHALAERDRIRIFSSVVDSESGQPLRAALATVERSANPGLLKPRKLSSLTNYYSSLYAPVYEGTNLRRVAQELAEAIAGDTPPWDVIDLKPLDVASPVFTEFRDGLISAGFVVQTYFCFGNWYLDVGGRTYREYFDGLRSSVRNIAKSKNKKIERSGRVRCEISGGIEGLETRIAAYNQVYEASWKLPEPYPKFIPGLIRTCATQGTLRLGLAYVDDEPAAAQVWIVHSGVASIYKIAYNQKFKELSVGTYLMTKMMEHVIDVDRVNEVDYLTGDDGYKKDWMSRRRERWGILAMNPRTIHGVLAIVRHAGGRAVKRAAVSLVDRFQRREKLQSTT